MSFFSPDAGHLIKAGTAGATTGKGIEATEPGIESLSGSYFVDRRPVEPDIRGRDDTAASRLWDLSARATGCTIRSPHPADGGTVPER